MPDKDLVVVVLSDRLDGKDGDLRDELIDAFAAVPSVTTPRPVGATTTVSR